MFINWLNDVVAERAYSRKLEEEADSVGLDLMARAGYDPRAMLDLWELMAAVEADAESMGYTRSMETRFQLLRTHPTSEARQEAIARRLPKAMQLFQETRTPKRAAIEKILAEKAKKEKDDAAGAGASAIGVAAAVAAVDAAHNAAATEAASVRPVAPVSASEPVAAEPDLEPEVEYAREV